MIDFIVQNPCETKIKKMMAKYKQILNTIKTPFHCCHCDATMVNTLAPENETEQVIELMLQVSPPWLPSILNRVTRQLFGRWFLSNHFGSRAKYFGNLISHVVFPFFCNNSG